MNDFLKNKQLWTFVGGAVTALAGAQFLKSSTARELAVKGLAKGMQLREDAAVSLETMKEDAKDICYEAKARNKG